MTSKRKNSFNSDWEKDYEFVKRSRKGDSYFYCSICQKDCNAESMGVSAITAHQNCKAHKQIVEERRKSSIGQRSSIGPSVYGLRIFLQKGWRANNLIKILYRYDLKKFRNKR